MLDQNGDDDNPNECIVFRTRSRFQNKSIKSKKLNEEFARVTDDFGLRLFIKKAPKVIDIIVIESSDEDESESTRNSAGQAGQSNGGNEAHQSVSASSRRLNFVIRWLYFYGSLSLFFQSDETQPIVKREPSIHFESSDGPATAATSVLIDWTRINDEEKFGLSLGQRLAKLPDVQKRRKVECVIQEAVLDAEKEAVLEAEKDAHSTVPQSDCE